MRQRSTQSKVLNIAGLSTGLAMVGAIGYMLIDKPRGVVTSPVPTDSRNTVIEPARFVPGGDIPAPESVRAKKAGFKRYYEGGMLVYGLTTADNGFTTACHADRALQLGGGEAELDYICEGKDDGGVVVETPENMDFLERVNREGNVAAPASRSTDDRVYYKRFGVRYEFWTCPADGLGDCEDRVICKNGRLVGAGFPQSALRIAVLWTASGSRHAVLFVKTDRGRFLVLDNQRDEILTARQTIDDYGYRYEAMQSGNDREPWLALNAQEVREEALGWEADKPKPGYGNFAKAIQSWNELHGESRLAGR